MTERWTLDLATLLRALRARWWLIGLTALVAGGLAFALSMLQDDRYEATADLLFRPSDPAPRIDPATAPPDAADAPERTAATNLALASADTVARQVKSKLRSPLSVDELRERVELAPEGQADIVTVTASGGSRDEAARIANAFAEEVVALRRRTAEAKVQRVIDAISSRLAAVPRDSGTAEELSRRAEQLRVEKGLQTGDVELAEPAIPPRERSSPRPLTNSAIGLVLGLLVGVALALVLQRLDRRIESEDELADIVGAPTIGRIPLAKETRWERELFYEGFQFLRANLQLREEARDCRTIAVTSALPGNGKSTVTVGLAKALAASGSTVVAVDGDLRRPTLHQNFGVPAEPGMTNIIGGGADVLEQLQPTLLAPVSLLAAGPALPISASVMAASKPLQELFQTLRGVADYVIVDTAPVTIGADASTIATAVDGVIVVVDQATVKREALKAANEQLTGSGAHVIGVVLNRASVLLAEEAYRGYYGSGAEQLSADGERKGKLRKRDSEPIGLLPGADEQVGQAKSQPSTGS